MRKRILVIASAALALAACKQPDARDRMKLVTCSGTAQMKLVSDRENSEINTGSEFSSPWFDLAKSNFQIKNIRTLDQDEKHASCEATLVSEVGLSAQGEKIITNGRLEQSGLGEMLAFFDKEREVRFSIRQTDDGKKLFLENATGFINSSEHY